MNNYVDEDLESVLLTKLLRAAGHVVVRPAEIRTLGVSDPLQLLHAIRDSRVLLSGNHVDFKALHALVLGSEGHHPGIMIVRSDNDSARDLSVRGIVHCIRKLESSGNVIADDFHILNHWR